MEQTNLTNYYDLQESYYNYLHEKLRERFKGEGRKQNGMVRTGGYHSQWKCLTDLDNYKICQIAMKCMEGDFVMVEARNGDSEFEAIITPDSFPKMIVLRHLNNGRYGRLEQNKPYNLWECNEVLTTKTPQ